MAMLDLTALAASLSKISKDKAISSLSPALGSEAFIQPKYLATVCRHNSRSRLRAFSSSHSPDSISPEEDQLTKAKFVRFFAAIFMLTAGIRVAPHVAVNAVDHTIKLLDAEEEMLVSAGLSRLVLLLKMESAQKRAVESDVLPRLVRLIESASSSLSCDDGKNLSLACRAMDVLAAVCQVPEGIAAAKQEKGLRKVLQQFLDNTPRVGGTEDALHAAKRVLRELDADQEA